MFGSVSAPIRPLQGLGSARTQLFRARFGLVFFRDVFFTTAVFVIGLFFLAGRRRGLDRKLAIAAGILAVSAAPVQVRERGGPRLRSREPGRWLESFQFGEPGWEPASAATASAKNMSGALVMSG